MAQVTESPDKPISTKVGTASDVFGNGQMIYVMHFRAGNRPPMQKQFTFKGDLPKAIERAKLHCTKMDYRFCGCYPAIVDLDEQEKRMEDNLNLHSL